MSDLLLRRAEREGATAPPGSPERQRFLCELHRTGVDPLPLVPGDRVRCVHYFANRDPSIFDGRVGMFAAWDLTATAGEATREIETVVRPDDWAGCGVIRCSYIEPEGLS